MTLRPDVLLNKFIPREEALNIGKSIIVNENYWYNAKFNGTECNEYMDSTENFLELTVSIVI